MNNTIDSWRWIEEKTNLENDSMVIYHILYDVYLRKSVEKTLQFLNDRELLEKENNAVEFGHIKSCCMWTILIPRLSMCSEKQLQT